MNSYDRLMNQINRKRENERASDREVARLTGQSIEEFDADTTADNPQGDTLEGQTVIAYGPTEYGPRSKPVEKHTMTNQTIIDVLYDDETIGMHDCGNGQYLPVWRNGFDGNWYYS